MTGAELDPISLEDARNSYLQERRDDARYETHRTISDATAVFVDWTENAEIENINVIRGQELRNFKHWCKTESENNTVSLNGILSNIRRFLEYCVDIEAVGSDVPDKTPVPTVPDDDVHPEREIVDITGLFTPQPELLDVPARQLVEVLDSFFLASLDEAVRPVLVVPDRRFGTVRRFMIEEQTLSLLGCNGSRSSLSVVIVVTGPR